MSIFLQSGISRSDAEDMTQDVFVRMMSVDTINETTAVAMAVKIAFNLRVDYFRKRRITTVDIDSAANVVDTHSCSTVMTLCNEINRFEQEAINTLSSKLAKVYEMNKMEELPAKEIALRMGISMRTVENHIYKSRRVVRNYLSKIL